MAVKKKISYTASLNSLNVLYYFLVIIIHCLSTVPEDLSLEERDELSNIRRRKKELLDDIEVSTLM